MSVAGRTVVIGGATSTSGVAAVRELAHAGARVIAVGRDPDKLDSLLFNVTRARGEGDDGGAENVRTEVCDLTDEASVARLVQRVHDADGAVDGVVHLVGGWRGGGGLAGQNEVDFRFLEGSFTALRHLSRACDSDLKASGAGRLAVVSSTAVARPLAGGANYAAVKSATEAWARAVAQGYAKDARDAARPLTAAAVIFRVTSLAGLEEALARRFVDLWNAPATRLNDTTLDLTAPDSSSIGQP
ncbi:SDR family NAD(P)-dependent oxidoreductase [Demequina aurantiaca]|uniref:SDR family NAD(P)-dependent oxidoreductase n=1 Tax=Demequina aurantiaca TaxID=676200 RepID=UPI00078554D2|nr:SDR family oxidoreductase [Demequina aurantiaca]